MDARKRPIAAFTFGVMLPPACAACSARGDLCPPVAPIGPCNSRYGSNWHLYAVGENPERITFATFTSSRYQLCRAYCPSSLHSAVACNRGRDIKIAFVQWIQCDYVSMVIGVIPILRPNRIGNRVESFSARQSLLCRKSPLSRVGTSSQSSKSLQFAPLPSSSEESRVIRREGGRRPRSTLLAGD
jgi:hypothetical protein